MTSRAPASDPGRVERLRADAERSLRENLEEAIALSHKLLSFAGAAAKR